MEERTERHTRQPLIHGRMIYRCEQCGKSWPMYLEKGVEEFGANHKPSPFTITCPYCGGLAMDVSGIQKVPGGGYVTLPDGYGYFANLEDRDCGVPILREVGVVRSGAKILVAAEDEEVLEDIQARVNKCINDIISAEFAELAGEEVEKFAEAAGIFAYYFGIPAMRAELAVERAELEDEYDGLRGTSYDGAPHSSTPGKPTEELAARVDARNVWNRLEKIAVRDHVLIVDRENIRGCLDVLKGEYKKLIFAKYRDKYSWARIAASNGIPDRTARWQHDKALDRLGEALEEVPMADELLGRASRARD